MCGVADAISARGALGGARQGQCGLQRLCGADHAHVLLRLGGVVPHCQLLAVGARNVLHGVGQLQGRKRHRIPLVLPLISLERPLPLAYLLRFHQALLLRLLFWGGICLQQPHHRAPLSINRSLAFPKGKLLPLRRPPRPPQAIPSVFAIVCVCQLLVLVAVVQRALLAPLHPRLRQLLHLPPPLHVVLIRAVDCVQIRVVDQRTLIQTRFVHSVRQIPLPARQNGRGVPILLVCVHVHKCVVCHLPAPRELPRSRGGHLAVARAARGVHTGAQGCFGGAETLPA
mmetsp:Transcript_14808/g.32687  ORF Transcript_14808/g.32687 Transcript_14808/m.32687 type:complete len:285 (-) Transcript_14808:92-946(-)